MWTVLYAMIAASIFIYFRALSKPYLSFTVCILVLHLASNFAWTYLFFGLHSPGKALADILFMDVSLAALLVLFWLASHTASLILLPYLLWCLFATYLNYGFFKLN